MSSAQPQPYFGAGRDEPYDTALGNGGGVLRLVDSALGYEGRIELGRFMTAADEADLGVLGRCTGPVLDVGCGPGRMVRAAIMTQRLCLGVDVSSAAVEHARTQGLPVLHRSVFDSLPCEGQWGAVLLHDGNIGIGGEPATLLSRCAELLAPDGSIFVETHPHPGRDAALSATLVDGAGGVSEPFPWCETGAQALLPYAQRSGLRPEEQWSTAGRTFVRLCRIAAASAPRGARVALGAEGA